MASSTSTCPTWSATTGTARARDVFGSIRLRVDPGADFLIGQGERDVRCHHHQAVRQHPGFTAVAWSDDGIVEAIAAPLPGPGSRFCVAVQWHPEVGEDLGVCRSFVRAAGGESQDT